MKFDWSRLYTRAKAVCEKHQIPVLSQQEVRFGRDLLQTMIADSCDILMMVEGDRGVGKSLAAGRICQILGVLWVVLGYWKEPYERYRLIWDSRDLARMARDYTSLKMGDVNLIEEPQTTEMSNKRMLTLEGQLAASFIRASRERQLINIITTTDDEILNEVFRRHKTHTLEPPFGAARRYIKSGYTSGRARTINKKVKRSVWVLKYCQYSPSLGRSISRYKREVKKSTGKLERKMFVYTRHPGKRWVNEYEAMKPAALEHIFSRTFDKLEWADEEATKEAPDDDSW